MAVFETKPSETNRRFESLGIFCHVHVDSLEYPDWVDFGAADLDWRGKIPESLRKAWSGLNYSEKMIAVYFAEQLLAKHSS